MYTKDYRKKYEMETRFRLQPKCFSNFTLYKENISSSEIDEVCIANNTMNYQDYLQCRFFDLTVEIFYNNGVFNEYINLINQFDIKASDLIKKINKDISNSTLKELYTGFLKENDDCLWKDRSELEKYIKSNGAIDKIIEQNLRDNEQLTYRAKAFFEKMQDLHDIVLKNTRELLNEKSALNDERKDYLNQLTRFSLLRKNNLRSLDQIVTEKFSYDFIKIAKSNFKESPFSYFQPKEVNINFSHTPEQQKIFTSYLKQFGSSIPNLGTMLSRSSVNSFYRSVYKC